ncbi:hypothetical protein EGR_05650 [Echinococcus granulosus]|uniref:Uncharacterized protein n=1 Tax=Echinococcus granulosus TaxID=6210 RepID=W6UDS3_ECHGR|nr:hypothetical protein EGR_05650 [Echinococcus granulosus]EUB59500.1 hypothetical protein EGR_05650 [Echinococcus granulosus]
MVSYVSITNACQLNKKEFSLAVKTSKRFCEIAFKHGVSLEVQNPHDFCVTKVEFNDRFLPKGHIRNKNTTVHNHADIGRIGNLHNCTASNKNYRLFDL